ncbi:MAG: iron donor protein CyaY [Proteobacteria bacterium]|nr:iron donor protein CyaY [Pseudomonadota bacterium]MCP4920047.1 iron donor protein CyaY [Pseudomonadota bacterium]
MTEPEFRTFVKSVLSDLFDQIDEFDTDDLDPTLSDGVLKVEFESGGTYVLSQQVPTREIWLSANLTAWHFKYADGEWNERDSGEPIRPMLSKLFSDKLGMPVQF